MVLLLHVHRFTLENLQQFQHMLSDKTPMFQIDAVLVPPDITMRPTPPEVCNILGYNIKHFLNRYDDTTPLFRVCAESANTHFVLFATLSYKSLSVVKKS